MEPDHIYGIKASWVKWKFTRVKGKMRLDAHLARLSGTVQDASPNIYAPSFKFLNTWVNSS